jgi:hypothetical protein
MKKEELYIYRAEIPDIVGYGCYGNGKTIYDATMNLRKAYNQVKKEWNITNESFNTFPKAYEYFGGNVRKLMVGSYGLLGQEE